MRGLVQAFRKLSSQRSQKNMIFSDLHNLRLIGNAQGRLINNKAGRAVYRARYRGREIKLYEAYSEKHANFIAALSAALPDVFPAVIELRGAWVMAEWVDGFPLSLLAQVEQVDILKRLHSVPRNTLPSTGFCYWKDFLLPRFMRVTMLFDRKDQILSLLEDVVHAPNVDSFVMHPDLSPANILRTIDGRDLSIDNELVCTGNLPLLDLCNAMSPLKHTERQKMRALWFTNYYVEHDEIERTALAWLAREVGAAFVSGNLPLCDKLLNAMLSNPLDYLPFCLDEASSDL